VSRNYLLFFLCSAALTVPLAIFSCKYSRGSSTAGFEQFIPADIQDTFYLNPTNQYSPEKALLGRYLFYDRRLSLNNTKACASCHSPEFSFTDGYNRSIGALGDLHQRNSKPLINLLFNKYLTAGDSSMHFPEQQIQKPLFNSHPVEMGWKQSQQAILQVLERDLLYKKMFSAAFPKNQQAVSVENVKGSITTFIKTIISLNSPWDRYTRSGNKQALSTSQKRGMEIFFSDRLRCKSCHAGINFSTPVLKNSDGVTLFYFNTGLYNIDKKGAYPLTDQGLKETTRQPGDMGMFRVPTLRNLAFTAPYFHDGSAQTIEEVINVYAQGGRVIANGPDAGDGRKNPYKNPLISGFSMNQQERKDIVNFLLSLSDSTVVKNPSYTNPFMLDETK
jgi:cytochrome c peroxidase